MAKIRSVEIRLADLPAATARVDATQTFTRQETPIVRITDADGVVGVGYSYTIGTGGSSILALIADHLAPLLIGEEADDIEHLWRALLLATHASAGGVLHSLALAAIDIALWDLRCRRAKLPLHKLAGGAKAKIPVYSTEGGWLQLPKEALVEDALRVKERGFAGAKFKVGKPTGAEDLARLEAVRRAAGDGFAIMTDANQSFSLAEAMQRAQLFQAVNVAWFEEPLLADNIRGHALLQQSCALPVAVGESLATLGQFRDYIVAGACAIVQVDVARVGGITPWLKTAHLAEAFGLDICPHFLMELHVALCCAVPNSRWLEYIPQLDPLTTSPLKIADGFAAPSDAVGLGIDWDWKAIDRLGVASPRRIGAK